MTRKLSYRYVFTQDELNEQSDLSQVIDYSKSYIDEFNHYHQLRFSNNNKRRFQPFNYSLLYEFAFSSTQNLNPTIRGVEYTYHKFFAQFEQTLFNTPKSKWSFNYRLFAGTILTDNSIMNERNFFNLSGSLDYTYDRAFFNRNGNQQQFYNGDASFKSNMFSGTYKSMIGVNIKVPTKIILPIGFFADAAYASISQDLSSSDLHYNYGIYLPMIKDIFEVYFPIGTSAKINSTINYSERIRFTIDLNVLQPLNLIRNIQIM